MSQEVEVIQQDNNYDAREFPWWIWPAGDPHHYWSFQVVPAGFGTNGETTLELQQFFYTQDSQGKITANFIMHLFDTVNGAKFPGGFFNLKGLRNA
jgi:hypothetical protein